MVSSLYTPSATGNFQMMHYSADANAPESNPVRDELDAAEQRRAERQEMEKLNMRARENREEVRTLTSERIATAIGNNGWLTWAFGDTIGAQFGAVANRVQHFSIDGERNKESFNELMPESVQSMEHLRELSGIKSHKRAGPGDIVQQNTGLMLAARLGADLDKMTDEQFLASSGKRGELEANALKSIGIRDRFVDLERWKEHQPEYYAIKSKQYDDAFAAGLKEARANYKDEQLDELAEKFGEKTNGRNRFHFNGRQGAVTGALAGGGIGFVTGALGGLTRHLGHVWEDHSKSNNPLVLVRASLDLTVGTATSMLVGGLKGAGLLGAGGALAGGVAGLGIKGIDNKNQNIRESNYRQALEVAFEKGVEGDIERTRDYRADKLYADLRAGKKAELTPEMQAVIDKARAAKAAEIHSNPNDPSYGETTARMMAEFDKAETKPVRQQQPIEKAAEEARRLVEPLKYSGIRMVSQTIDDKTEMAEYEMEKNRREAKRIGATVEYDASVDKPETAKTAAASISAKVYPVTDAELPTKPVASPSDKTDRQQVRT